jgi:plastocyanin
VTLLSKLCPLLAAGILGLSQVLPAAEVTGQVSITDAKGRARAGPEVRVVLWLRPLTNQPVAEPGSESRAMRAQLIQRNKVFNPHVIAVQVGSEVDFPNRDPFFHNVFSLFNGKRFDLGLYEAGSTRGVRFDRTGVCYIFCNIHPQMSAVIVVVDTPYFAVSDTQGKIVVTDVPPGLYLANYWAERCSAETLKAISRQVSINHSSRSLGTVDLKESEAPALAHLNKYGKQYDPDVFSNSGYARP